MQSRRDFIKNMALISGSLGLWGTLGGPIHRAMAIEPEPGSSYLDAEHIVILMQENRSFDHCFGSLRGVRGFNDPRAIKLPNGNPVWMQTDSSGKSFLPFRLNIKDTCATWMGALPHSWQSQVDARNQGNYDHWLQAKRSPHGEYADMPLTMGHYSRQDIPFYYELADAFTICDQHFCSSLTGTTPNRLHLWTGTIRARQSPDAQANVINDDADYERPVHWTTYPERLEDRGIPWKIYQNELGVYSGLTAKESAWLSNYEDNPIEYFTQFQVKFSKTYRDYLERQSQSLPKTIDALEQQLADAGLSASKRANAKKKLKSSIATQAHIQTEIKTWNTENYEKLSAREKSLHARAFCTNEGDPAFRQLAPLAYTAGGTRRQLQIPKGDVLHQFRKDVETGNLPTVSWIVAPQRFCDHPSSAWYGAWYISETMRILTQNPEVWKKTIFILTYDENDGYFDHVPPFVAPDPQRPESGFASKEIDTSLEYVQLDQDRKRVPGGNPRQSPIGLGFRVPMIIASPWSRGGCICSEVFDHTSSLQFLENFLLHKTGKSVRETNISSWRRTVCGDLTSAFQPAPKQGAPLTYEKRDQIVEQIYNAKFKPLPAGYKPLTAAEIAQIRVTPLESPLMPRQEQGVRPSCPLPYELYVDGTVNADKTRFTIRFKVAKSYFGKQSDGCPFTVYALTANGQLQIRNYAVAAGDQIEDTWNLNDFANNNYHLKIYGPNGFYREFIGGGDESPVKIRLDYSRDGSGKLNGNLEIAATNHHDHRTFAIEIADRSYKGRLFKGSVSPGETARRVVDTHRSFQWYDVAVLLPEMSRFEHRYAGRVETGQWNFSDPAMG